MSNNVKVHFFTQDGSKCIRIIRYSDISKEACNSFSSKGVNYFTANPTELFNQIKKLAEERHTIYSSSHISH